jgi:8-oxo-dGTP pyrophosphatase MutT (NUDIX family)
MSEPIKRVAVRAVVLSFENRVLLMRMQEPATGRELWVTPGGGVHGEESDHACLQRELLEETGLRDAAIGPCIWTRQHTFVWDKVAYAQSERYYLVRHAQFAPTVEGNPEHGEKSAFREFRWWSSADLADSESLFAPRLLANLVLELTQTGAPATARHVE